MRALVSRNCLNEAGYLSVRSVRMSKEDWTLRMPGQRTSGTCVQSLDSRFDLLQINKRRSVASVVGGEFAVPFLDGILLHEEAVERCCHDAVVVGFAVTLDLHGFGLSLRLGDGDLGLRLGFLHLVLGLQGQPRSWH